MSTRELERVEVMGRVAHKELKLTDAATILELSYRQVKRLWRRYQRKGRKGLQHGNVGRASNRSKPASFRRRVLSLIKQKYSGSEGERFGPTLAAEHLAEEDGITIDHETLRGWMLAEGLWSRQRKRKKHCQRRERKEHFGELVQLDGSFHDWLEERGPRGCLMNMVDDATGTTLAVWTKRRRSGQQRECCKRGSRNMACRVRCTPIGRMCTYAPRPRRSSCGEKFPSRSLGACVRSWGLTSSRPARPRPKGVWRGIMASIRMG